MSIGELTTVVNSNFNKPLNEQARELSFAGSYLITETKDFVPDVSGWYKIIVVGAGGKATVNSNQNQGASGGSGGVAIKTMQLQKNNAYPIVVDSNKSSFNTNIVATCGTNAQSYNSSGVGGTASGGDFNYDGINGKTFSQSRASSVDVGAFIPGLMTKESIADYDPNAERTENLSTGWSILGYGSCFEKGSYTSIDEIRGGCVLIIPLELEE